MGLINRRLVKDFKEAAHQLGFENAAIPCYAAVS